MTNNEYWKKRMLETYLDGEESALKLSKALKEQYSTALTAIENEIYKFYGKYATESKLDMTTVRKLLNKNELKSFKENLQELITYAKEHDMDKDFIYQKRLLNIKTKISRLEELKTNIEFQINKLAIEQRKLIKNKMAELYEDTYYRNIYNVDIQLGLATSFTRINDKIIEKALNREVDLRNYKVGLYNTKQNLLHILNKDIPQGLILGYNPNKLAKIVSKDLDTDFNSTVRLIRTEYNYIMNQATAESYKESQIDRYQILAALDERTCEECGALDLEIIPIDEKEVGLNYPPFHPNCRCITIPYFDPDEFDILGERVARNATGKSYMVPANLTYTEWKAGLVEHKDGTINYKS